MKLIGILFLKIKVVITTQIIIPEHAKLISHATQTQLIIIKYVPCICLRKHLSYYFKHRSIITYQYCVLSTLSVYMYSELFLSNLSDDSKNSLLVFCAINKISLTFISFRTSTDGCFVKAREVTHELI